MTSRRSPTCTWQPVRRREPRIRSVRELPIGPQSAALSCCGAAKRRSPAPAAPERSLPAPARSPACGEQKSAVREVAEEHQATAEEHPPRHRQREHHAEEYLFSSARSGRSTHRGMLRAVGVASALVVDACSIGLLGLAGSVPDVDRADRRTCGWPSDRSRRAARPLQGCPHYADRLQHETRSVTCPASRSPRMGWKSPHALEVVDDLTVGDHRKASWSSTLRCARCLQRTPRDSGRTLRQVSSTRRETRWSISRASFWRSGSRKRSRRRLSRK